ncbi:pentapeptide repeat-containing protein [Amycolatopsis samaneae]|uniref:Pentapeptide repeat-containing protein n=1 Tax=Amycolatopsis samaneae TaxID=664691 RepID=A0ABW5GTS1_9PSEU
MELPRPPARHWETCDQADERGEPCIGVQAGGTGRCLAHLRSRQRREVLAALRPGSRLSLMGTILLPELWDDIRDATNAVFGEADFTEATFFGPVSFADTKFEYWARFTNAVFAHGPAFDRATFSHNVSFEGATFELTSSFVAAVFHEAAFFPHTRFKQNVTFDFTEFHGLTDFGHADFQGGFSARSAVFHSPARFTGSSSSDTAVFDHAEFEAEDYSFDHFTTGHLSLGKATFRKPVVLDFSAGELSCVATRFEDAATIRLRGSAVVMDRAVFTAPSAITAVPAGPGEDRPELISLRGVDVTNLTLTDLDLRSCRFGGALHLDKLRLEGDYVFGRPPAGFRTGWAWPPVWRWTRRQVITEEGAWRATTAKGTGWATGEDVLKPRRIASLYRQLRKAQEDNKYEPGAAGFYYGEMEMRRNDRDNSLAERVILTLYWAASGYGLRASRAFACLTVLLLLAGFFFQHFGITGVSLSYGDGLLDVVGSAMGLDVVKPETLTRCGHVLRMIVRIGSPLFLGLAALAVRNRVKR